MTRTKVLHLTRKDFKWSYFKASGGGGQHRDKTDTGVRCYHPPSGAEGRASDSRSQWKNKQAAFKKCGESKEFKAWVNLEHARIAGDIDWAVKEAMKDQNLDVEFFTPEN